MFADLTVAQALEKLNTREVSAYELTASALRRINETEEVIRAFVTVTGEDALAAAAEVDRRRAAGEPVGALAGIPLALKDNICTKGILTTCSSKMLHNFIPPYDAAVVELLRQAGTILLSKR